MGAALKSDLRSQWIDCFFDTYDKMHRTGTLSVQFFLSQLPDDTTILRSRITCEVKITDSDWYKFVTTQYTPTTTVNIEVGVALTRQQRKHIEQPCQTTPMIEHGPKRNYFGRKY